MTKKSRLSFHRPMVVVHLLFALTFFYVILMLYADHRLLLTKGKKVEDLRLKLKKQALLLPQYKLLEDQLEFFNKIDDLFIETNPSAKECKIADTIEKIRDIGIHNSFELNRIDSGADLQASRMKRYIIQIHMKGTFERLHSFLIEVNQMACMSFIEKIDISAESQIVNISMKIWVLQD